MKWMRSRGLVSRHWSLADSGTADCADGTSGMPSFGLPGRSSQRFGEPGVVLFAGLKELCRGRLQPPLRCGRSLVDLSSPGSNLLRYRNMCLTAHDRASAGSPGTSACFSGIPRLPPRFARRVLLRPSCGHRRCHGTCLKASSPPPPPWSARSSVLDAPMLSASSRLRRSLNPVPASASGLCHRICGARFCAKPSGSSRAQR